MNGELNGLAATVGGFNNDGIKTAVATNISSNDTSATTTALKVLNWLHLYYLGAIVIVGVLGNARNVILFVRSKNELRSPSYYLAALASADVIFLAILLILWISHFDVDLFSWDGIYQTFFFFSSTSSCISAWLVVAFTFERLIVVRYPLKRPKMCTIRRAKIIIACLTVAAFIVQALSLFTTGVIDTTSSAARKSSTTTSATVHQKSFRSSKRDPLSEYYYQMKRAVVMIETVLTVTVPSFLIVFLNGLIVHSLQSERPSVSRVQFGRTFQTGANKHRSPSLSLNNRDEDLHPPQTETVGGKVSPSTSLLAVLSSVVLRADDDLPYREAETLNDQQMDGVLDDQGQPNGPLLEMHSMDLDAIETDPLQVSNDDDIEVNTDIAIDATEQRQQSQLINDGNDSELEESDSGEAINVSTRVEHTITKRLLIISTVHILLNLPGYGISLKIFIDETIRPYGRMSLITWLVQQYCMLLYYTNFAINFLLYSTTSVSLQQ